MRGMYIILCAGGWAWTLLVFVWLAWRLRRRPPGMDNPRLEKDPTDA